MADCAPLHSFSAAASGAITGTGALELSVFGSVTTIRPGAAVRSPYMVGLFCLIILII
jgi:hypothetical protein